MIPCANNNQYCAKLNFNCQILNILHMTCHKPIIYCIFLYHKINMAYVGKRIQNLDVSKPEIVSSISLRIVILSSKILTSVYERFRTKLIGTIWVPRRHWESKRINRINSSNRTLLLNGKKTTTLKDSTHWLFYLSFCLNLCLWYKNMTICIHTVTNDPHATYQPQLYGNQYEYDQQTHDL